MSLMNIVDSFLEEDDTLPSSNMMTSAAAPVPTRRVSLGEHSKMAALSVTTSQAPASSQKYVGTIKIMNNTYGFIKVLNNGVPYDVFVHAINIMNTKGEYKLKKRDVVSFGIKQEVKDGEIKHIATDVVLIQEGPINTPLTSPVPKGSSKTSKANAKRKWDMDTVNSPANKYRGSQTSRSANNTPMVFSVSPRSTMSVEDSSKSPMSTSSFSSFGDSTAVSTPSSFTSAGASDMSRSVPSSPLNARAPEFFMNKLPAPVLSTEVATRINVSRGPVSGNRGFGTKRS